MTLRERFKRARRKRQRARERRSTRLANLAALREQREQTIRRLERLRANRKQATGSNRERIQQEIAELKELLAELNGAIEAAVDRLERARQSFRRWQSLAKRLRFRLRQRDRDEVIPRSVWGAAPARGSYAGNTAITKRVQHHTVYPALSPSASVGEESARMRHIQAGHFARGFTDLGYHRVVFPSGRIYEGRPDWTIGAHVTGHNTGSVGVSADGNYDVMRPTDALVRGCKAAFQSLPGKDAPLYGHRQLGSTACPGRYLYDRLGDIE